MPMFISDNSECFTVRRGQPRARSVPRQDAADDDGRAGGHLPSGPVYTQHMPLGRHFCMHQYNELDAAEWRL